jgi:hypothetical protein
MSQDPEPKRTLIVGKDGILHIPKDIVAAEHLKPGDPVDAADIRLSRRKEVVAAEHLKPGDPVDAADITRRHRGHIEKFVSSRRFRLIILTIVLGVVGALGGLLIDWPLFTGFHTISAVWINLTAFLFPLGYIIITETAKRTRAHELISLLIGLFYGGVLWLQVVLEVFLRTPMEEAKKLDYLQGHIFDLFAVAAIVGTVSHFTAHEKRRVRMSWLAGVFTVTGAILGFIEMEVLLINKALPGYPYWTIPLLWALTGIWFGLCIGYVAPDLKVVKILRREQEGEAPRQSSLQH